MANLLIIESATDICSVAILKNETELFSRELLEPFRHSERLTILIQESLALAGLQINELDAVGLSSGPGSYTSLRVGASVAKGLCFGLDIPLVALDTLEGIAIGMKKNQPEADYFIPLIDARRMEVYCTVYDRDLNVVKPCNSLVLEEDSFYEYSRRGKVLLGGNGAAKTRTLFLKSDFIYSEVERCNAVFFEKKIQERYFLKEFVDMASFEPSYLKSPAITRPKPLL